MQRESLLLKVDNKGWNIELFEDKVKASTCLCGNCNSVCCDAVELGCNHNDDEIYLYCNHCLKQLINDNDNKCPIDSHNDPIISSSRATRRQIAKLIVLCPYSLKYKEQQNKANDNNDGQIMDTMVEDQKEGNDYKNIAIYQQEIYGNQQLQMRIPDILQSDKGCVWKGTLSDLINKHIVQCMKANNHSLSSHEKMRELEHKNNELNQQIVALQKELTHQKWQNDQFQFQINAKIAIISSYKDKMKELENKDTKQQEINQQTLQNMTWYKNKIEQQNQLIINQNSIIDDLRLENMELKSKSFKHQQVNINQQSMIINELKKKVEHLQQELKTTYVVIENQENQMKVEKVKNDELKNQLQQQFILMQELMDGNNSYDEKQENDDGIASNMPEGMQFEVEETMKHKFKNVEHTKITYKSSTFLKLNSSRFTFGPFLKDGDKFTVCFEMKTIGSAANYQFGFATSASTMSSPMSHAMMLYGDGTLETCDEFCAWNDEFKGTVIIPAMQNLFDKSLERNIIVISVNMNEKTAWIWNDNEKQCKFRFILPSFVRITIALHGTDEKTIILKNIY